MYKIDHAEFNYHGFDIKKACEQIEGDLTYLGTFCIQGNYTPCAVFSNANPNRAKGHKPYCFLLVENKQILIGGMESDQMEQERYQTGLYCKLCKTTIYSVNRHDFRFCKCKDKDCQIAIDGGKDYTNISYGKDAAYEQVLIDFVTSQIVPLLMN